FIDLLCLQTDKYYKIAPFALFVKVIPLIINDLFMMFVDLKDLRPYDLGYFRARLRSKLTRQWTKVSYLTPQ
ncbi:hypothetical protein, partial [Parashewanella curva]|uniref:hypothetical protein n=1 Tax=Parashewanella curva TaxID=2338552 RepID=UPI001A9D419C